MSNSSTANNYVKTDKSLSSVPDYIALQIQLDEAKKQYSRCFDDKGAIKPSVLRSELRRKEQLCDSLQKQLYSLDR